MKSNLKVNFLCGTELRTLDSKFMIAATAKSQLNPTKASDAMQNICLTDSGENNFNRIDLC
jgi:hypothetical protein